MTRVALSLALLCASAACSEAPPELNAVASTGDAAAPAAIAPPPPFKGGSPQRPAMLPAARSCQEALADGVRDESLPGQVNGELVAGADGLRRLRASWGDGLIVVRGGDYRGADLRGSRLHNICFVGSDFAKSDWRGVEAAGIGFLYSDLTGAKLAGARMAGVTIRHPNLAGADATGADLSGGLLSGNAIGSWDGLRLDRADLRRFRFDCGRNQGDQCVSYWRKASFRGADLRGARIDTHWGDADWTGARLDGTRVSLRQLPRLAAARIEGPLVVREGGTEVRLSPAEYAQLRPHLAAEERDLPLQERRPSRAGGWMKPGAAALFAAPPIAFDAAARKSPLYRRLLPAIVAGTGSAVLVTVGRDGTIDALGTALGGNDHMCGLEAKGLRLDPATGWYSGRSAPPPGGPDAPRAAPVPVLRFDGDAAQVHLHGIPGWAGGDPRPSDYVTCGARASFLPMIRLPATAAEARALWARAPQ